jgi:hypothetical protein
VVNKSLVIDSELLAGRQKFAALKFHVPPVIFFTLNKTNWRPAPVPGYMRQTRKLARGIWHEIRSGVNNRERILRAKAFTLN